MEADSTFRRAKANDPSCSLALPKFGRFHAALTRGTARCPTTVVVTDPDSRKQSTAGIAVVNTPMGYRLSAGIHGEIDGEPFMAFKARSFAFTRASREIVVSGPVGLVVTYRRPWFQICRTETGEVLWRSRIWSAKDQLSDDTTLPEAAVMAALIKSNTYLANYNIFLRFLSFV